MLRYRVVRGAGVWHSSGGVQSAAIISGVRGTVGALRTAEELGRAFRGVPVISSAGDHVRASVGAEPALVVATPGAEPVAFGGYAAALLLDADSMLRFDSLRALRPR